MFSDKEPISVPSSETLSDVEDAMTEIDDTINPEIYQDDVSNAILANPDSNSNDQDVLLLHEPQSSEYMINLPTSLTLTSSVDMDNLQAAVPNPKRANDYFQKLSTAIHDLSSLLANENEFIMSPKYDQVVSNNNKEVLMEVDQIMDTSNVDQSNNTKSKKVTCTVTSIFQLDYALDQPSTSQIVPFYVPEGHQYIHRNGQLVYTGASHYYCAHCKSRFAHLLTHNNHEINCVQNHKKPQDQGEWENEFKNRLHFFDTIQDRVNDENSSVVQISGVSSNHQDISAEPSEIASTHNPIVCIICNNTFSTIEEYDNHSDLHYYTNSDTERPAD